MSVSRSEGKAPIVFACSGCSNAGQAANQAALELDRRGLAEMSCLAGIGAGKRHFLRQLAGREVWIIDGCPIECSLGVFRQVGEHVDVHIRLQSLGVRKNETLPADAAFEQLMAGVLGQVKEQTRRAASGEVDGCPPRPGTTANRQALR